MSTILTPDICVIGGGSGGLTVAAVAASFGVDVVLIEKGKMGGDCLNYGCVPSKAILAAGKSAYAISEAKNFGIGVGKDIKVDFKKVNAHIHSVINTIAPNDSVERFTSLGVKVIEAGAVFIDPKTITAGEYTIQARRYVIATGSSPFVPPIPGLDKTPYFTNETLFDNTHKFAHLIIIGGGPIGMEMAQAHKRLGCEVTVIEAQTAFGQDDPELSDIVIRKIREEGVSIIEGASVSEVKKRGKTGVSVTYKVGNVETKIDGSDILVATGRAANVNGLGLEAAGIDYTPKGIKTKPDLRTTNKRVYAIGDVIGGLQFTHVAGYHAGLVIRGLLFRKKAVPNNNIVPWVTYTEPEIAHVGMNEEAARKHAKNIHVLRFPYHENDRAIAERKTTGMIKMISNKKGKILGVTIAGANAGEMINMWALALSKDMSVKDVASYIPPYPTMSEIGKRAATSFYAPLTRKPFIRSVIKFLRVFG